MPDITMCDNSECLLRATCYRYMAIPSDFRQSYSTFVPEGKRNEVKCSYFMPIGFRKVRENDNPIFEKD
ncbi:hypothetical protein [Flavobacterium filum]|uniref:hypothetical protein n=1 Tax=Flavobacterium filum TaxID=370974 RepID=UPI0023F00C6F|nr:hypothetical protein [Flavobacterium filum]